METKQNVLTFKIDTKEPIGIDELAESLKAIGELYSQKYRWRGRNNKNQRSKKRKL